MSFLENYFLNPWGLLGLILVPILIILYIIKHRTRDEVVSSTYMWKRTAKHMKRRVPINLRNLLLILLQIVAVTLASFIIARPQFKARDTGEVIAIIDASHSMNSLNDDGVSRIERAKQKIDKLAQIADANHRVSVILAGDEAEVLCRREENRINITTALGRVKTDWGDADIEGALELAKGIQQDNLGAKIVFYTDTTYGKLTGLTTELMTDEEWNAAVLDVDVTRPAGAFSFEAQVASYGKDETLTVALYVDGEYVDSKRVECKNGESTKVSFNDTYKAAMYERAEVSIVLPEKTVDAFADDNKVGVFYQAEERTRVQVVFAPEMRDDFLLAALSSNDIVTQVVNVEKLTPEGYEDRKNGTVAPKIKYAGYKAYIFVGVIPEEIPQDGTMWLMNPPMVKDGSGMTKSFDFKGELGLDIEIGSFESYIGTEYDKGGVDAHKGFDLMPGITPSENEFSILSGLSFLDTTSGQESVKVSSYYPITSNTYKPLLVCDRSKDAGKDNGAVMMVGKGDRHARLIVSTIVASELAMRAENVLLISNLIRYAIPTLFETGKYSVGDSMDIKVPAGINGFEVLCDNVPTMVVGEREYQKPSADGAENSYQVDDSNIAFVRPGNYTINMYLSSVDINGDPIPGGESVITHRTYVSLSNAESDIYRILDSSLVTEPPEGAIVTYEPEEIWLYLLIALLVVLTAEWWVYHHA